MDNRDWLFLVETVFLYGGLVAFGLWEVWKMRRDLREIRAKKAEKQRTEAETSKEAGDAVETTTDKSV